MKSAAVTARNTTTRGDKRRGGKIVACIALALAVAGCATTEEAQERRIEELRAIAAVCKARGYQPGTDEIAACMMALDQQQRSAPRQIVTPQPPLPMPRQTQCTPGPGGTINCTTY